MALATSCPNCRTVLRSANPLHAGKRVRCPKCNETFLVPEPEPAMDAPVVEIDEEDDPPPVAEIDEDEDSGPPIRRKATARRTEYPNSVLTAGIIWVVYGVLFLLNTFVIFWQGVVLVVHEDPQHAGPMKVFVVCVGVFLGLIAVAFIWMGAQSIRGASRDILGRSIVSIIVGALGLLSAAGQLLVGNVLVGIIGFILGAVLILAGVLALQARDAYKLWRSAQKPERSPKR
jgi:predicted Zn finger-like uncharacterized protein